MSYIVGLLPLLPLESLPPVEVLGASTYETPEEYLRHSHVLLPGPTRRAMTENRFQRATTIGYEAGLTFFGVEGFRLGSPEEAATFHHALLDAACQNRVAYGFAPIAGVQSGVLYAYHDSDRPGLRAGFLIDDMFIRLNVCVCVDYDGDAGDLAARWARVVDARLRELSAE